MIIRGVSARERKTIAIGGACIIAILVVTRGAPALIAWRRDLHSTAEENRSALADARAVLAEDGVVNDWALKNAKRVIALAPLLLSGDTPASASASLEGIISGAAAASNVQLGALELKPDSASRSAFTRILVKGSANGDIRGLSRMLQQIEQGPALIAVDELSITQPELVGAPDHMETLHMELIVCGLMLTPRAAAGAR